MIFFMTKQMQHLQVTSIIVVIHHASAQQHSQVNPKIR